MSIFFLNPALPCEEFRPVLKQVLIYNEKLCSIGFFDEFNVRGGITRLWQSFREVKVKMYGNWQTLFLQPGFRTTANAFVLSPSPAGGLLPWMTSASLPCWAKSAASTQCQVFGVRGFDE